MKIDIKTTHIDLTPALTEFIEEKIGSLDKFMPRHFAPPAGGHGSGQETIQAFVEIARTTTHHRHGGVFRAEVNMKVGGRVIRAAQEGQDIRAAIDGVREELKLELQKEKGISESKFRKGARALKRLTSISPMAWFRKEK
ncbi:MAG: ribosome-associated translation inhibitor RaiA [Patescibacteria group bacterium]